jgi:hypothetical protein
VKIESEPVRRFLIAQLICTFIFAAIVAIFWGRLGFVSTALGGAVAMMNAVGTAFAWPRLLEKKDVALALSIIVSKFALSIGIFYWLSSPVFGAPSLAMLLAGDNSITLGSVPGTMVAFALGLTSVVPAALIVAAKDLRSSGTKEDF